jgi:hypothetical protein
MDRYGRTEQGMMPLYILGFWEGLRYVLQMAIAVDLAPDSLINMR